MPILEKVFAKYHGNYTHLGGGWMDAAVRSLWGSPSKSIWHDPATMTAEQLDALWLELQGHDFANEIITSAALSRSTGCNLVLGHAYTTLRVLELTDGTRLVKVRNPWGSEQWTCDWRDSDNVNWTAERRAEAETAHTQENPVNDGVFWVSFEDYVQHFEVTMISYDTEKLHQDYFLMLDDPSSNPGKWSWCGPTCSRHTLTVTSEVDQNVWFTAHTWDKRGKPDECEH
jgi:hypothetical protein